MPDREQDETLSTLLVKEAVSKGLESPMRDPILDAVEETEGSGSVGTRIPLAGGLLGLGVAIGYLIGSETTDSDRSPLSKVEESVGDVAGESGTPVADIAAGDEVETEAVESDSDADSKDGGGSSRLKQIGLALVAVAGIELLRRRRGSGEGSDWEPIEEFEPATSATFDDEEGGDEESGEEAEIDEGSDETDETVEE